jgi:hypothetical protein
MWYAQGLSYKDHEISYDDIDILFSQLQTIEPPPSIVARILGQVKAQAMNVKNPSQPLTRPHPASSVYQGKRRDTR